MNRRDNWPVLREEEKKACGKMTAGHNLHVIIDPVQTSHLFDSLDSHMRTVSPSTYANTESLVDQFSG